MKLNVMLARQSLRRLSCDLSDTEAKRLCNQLDYSLRTDNRSLFLEICSSTPSLVSVDTDAWRIRERLQVISLIRFPLWDIDEEDVFLRNRIFVESLSSSSIGKSPSDREIWKAAGELIDELLPSPGCLRHTTGRHGPGIVSETSKPHKKRQVVSYSERLRYIIDHSFKVPDNCGGWLPLTSAPKAAKVVLVPKDHKTLRPISAEPAHTQFLQQLYRELLERNISKAPWCRGIRLRDQEFQRSLVREGCATIDLSSASDTIRMRHLWYLGLSLEKRSLLLTLRTPTQVFQGCEWPTQGLFPMGAAVCFPFETLLFYSLLLCYSVAETGRIGKVGVFGDDICCEPALAGGFQSFLRRSGFVPNSDKSYVSGFFFEACGLHLYKGIDVTPVKLKKKGPVSSEDLTTLSYSSYAARSEKHFPSLAKFLRELSASAVLLKRWNCAFQHEEALCLTGRQRTEATSDGYYEALIGRGGRVAIGAVTATYSWQTVGYGLGD